MQPSFFTAKYFVWSFTPVWGSCYNLTLCSLLTPVWKRNNLYVSVNTTCRPEDIWSLTFEAELLPISNQTGALRWVNWRQWPKRRTMLQLLRGMGKVSLCEGSVSSHGCCSSARATDNCLPWDLLSWVFLEYLYM